jgi:hypothetical protein
MHFKTASARANLSSQSAKDVCRIALFEEAHVLMKNEKADCGRIQQLATCIRILSIILRLMEAKAR